MKMLLMSDIFYKEKIEDDWQRWSYTDGCPTGREYSVYIRENVTPNLGDITEYLNSYVTCIYEKHINPVIIKFDLTNLENQETTQVLLS